MSYLHPHLLRVKLFVMECRFFFLVLTIGILVIMPSKMLLLFEDFIFHPRDGQAKQKFLIVSTY